MITCSFTYTKFRNYLSMFWIDGWGFLIKIHGERRQTIRNNTHQILQKLESSRPACNHCKITLYKWVQQVWWFPTLGSSGRFQFSGYMTWIWLTFYSLIIHTTSRLTFIYNKILHFDSEIYFFKYCLQLDFKIICFKTLLPCFLLTYL